MGRGIVLFERYTLLNELGLGLGLEGESEGIGLGIGMKGKRNALKCVQFQRKEANSLSNSQSDDSGYSHTLSPFTSQSSHFQSSGLQQTH